MFDSVHLQALRISIFSIPDYKLTEEPAPVSQVIVSDSSVSEVFMCVDNKLSYRWGAKMSYVKWFSYISTEVIHHDCLTIRGPILWYKRREELSPGAGGEAEVDVSAHDGGVAEVFGSLIYGVCELLGDRWRGEAGGFRE